MVCSYIAIGAIHGFNSIALRVSCALLLMHLWTPAGHWEHCKRHSNKLEHEDEKTLSDGFMDRSVLKQNYEDIVQCPGETTRLLMSFHGGESFLASRNS